MFSPLRVLVFAQLIFFAALHAEAGVALPESFRTVVLSGDSAPGTLENFTGFSPPVLNNLGAVAFGGEFGEDFSSGIWSEAAGLGVLNSVAVTGDAAPGGGSAVFDSFESLDARLQFSDLGDTVFTANLDDGVQGLWTDRDRSTTPISAIAVQGAAAPGTIAPRAYNFGFQSRSIGTTTSEVAFFNSLGTAPPPNNFPSQAIFSEGGGSGLGAVAEVTELAPGTFRPPGIGGGAGTLANFNGFGPPTINNAGHVAFRASTNAGGSVDSIGDQGVWAHSPSSGLRAVALHGQLAPGASAFGANVEFGQTFDDSAVINEAGNVAFTASLNVLAGGQIPRGVWVERAGGVQKVAIESEAAPLVGTTLDTLRGNLIDGAGNAVFVAELADGRDALFRERAPGDFRVHGLQGFPAVGTGKFFENVLDFAVNTVGQVAFSAQLDDGSDGIFATDTAGVLHKIAAAGDTIDVAGFTAEIEFVSFASTFTGDSLTSGLNDNGQVAFLADLFSEEAGFEEMFPEGLSGIFVGVTPNPPPAFQGDFNEDFVVTAADYVVWRDGAVDNGDPARYDEWAGNFGASDLGVVASGQVPEPPALLAAIIGVGLLVNRRCVNQRP